MAGIGLGVRVLVGWSGPAGRPAAGPCLGDGYQNV